MAKLDGQVRYKLFLAMSRRRISSPLSVQQLWDAVKITRYKRQVPNIERITRYMHRVHNFTEEETTRQLNYCVRDGLLKVIKKVGTKGSKVGVEQEGYKLPEDQVDRDTHDWYCFICQSAGDVICCTSCHRVYHLACIDKDDLPNEDVKNKFVCVVCRRIANKDLSPNIRKRQLNRLLKITALKLKEWLPIAFTDRSTTNPTNDRFITQDQANIAITHVPPNFKWILSDNDQWRVDHLIYKQVNPHNMEIKTDNEEYEHIEEFRADVQTIVHNVVIYHGVHSNMADMARLMLRNCNNDLAELFECWLCFKHSNDKILRNWFCKPCKPPHELVYAKTKGNAYMPAKVLRRRGDVYEVRFFGPQHERAIVETSHIRPISVNIHNLQVKGTSAWNRACEELKRYQKQLEKLRIETDDFTKPFVDSSSESESSNNEEENEPDSDVEFQPEKEKTPEKPEIKRKKETISTISDDPTKNEKPREVKRRKSIAENNLQEEVDEQSPTRILRSRRTSSKDTHSPTPKRSASQSSESEKKLETKANGKVSRRRPRRSDTFSEGSPPTKISHSHSEPSPVEETGKDVAEIPTANLGVQKEVHKDHEEYNITSTSEKLQHLHKRNEEEIVSSSSSLNQTPVMRSVKVQTKPMEFKPSREWITQMQEQFEKEKQLIIEKLQKQHKEEMEMLNATHNTMISETKRKQWCVNCEGEAIYHCCWNNSYCSPDCQLAHWAIDHKRSCRRKR